MKFKFKPGELVIIKRVFKKNPDPINGNYDYSHGDLVVKIEYGEKLSMGNCYKLFHPTVDLGGVLYWETEIHEYRELDNEEIMWRMWGDQ